MFGKALQWLESLGDFLVRPMSQDNHPMHVLLRRQLGIDAFALDGDGTEIADAWQDRPRKVPVIPRP